MELRKIVTDYDEDLSGDAYIDPLGQLVIWSAFGEAIFHNQVNSISNDVRNYTLNLFNHWLIRDLMDDESVTLNKWLEEAIGDKQSLGFRQACLVYLENLFSYALVSAGQDDDVDTGGVLGSSKASLRLEQDKGDPVLELGHRKEAQLLVRQLGLGVSGRYKTPFMKIGFFDDRYNYHLPNSSKCWEKTDVLFKHSNALNSLYQDAREHMLTLLSSCTRKSNVPLQRRFRELPKKLIKAYRQTFATQGHAGRETRDFWLDLTRLDQGAAGALLNVLDLKAEQNEEILTPDLFSEAKKLCKSEADKAKMGHIQVLEPLLAESDLLFTLACHRRHQPVIDIEKLWVEFGRDADTLTQAAARCADMPGLREVLKGTALGRFNRLIDAASCSTFDEQLRELLDYHNWVMRIRGQFPWVEMVADGRVKVHARTQPLPDKEERANGHWVNSYYIPQFRNLVNGFRGVAV